VKLFERVVPRLRRYGWLPAEGVITIEAIDAAVEAFQRRFGLDAHGHLDPDTIAELEAPRFCGCPDTLPATAGAAALPPAAATFVFESGGRPLQGISDEQARAAVLQAAGLWTAELPGLTLREAGAGERPDLLITTDYPSDGPGGVLADCQLPGPRPQRMRLDRATPYVIQLGPMPRGVIDLLRVVAHEYGHFRGLNHLGRGLMAPTVSATVDRPTPEDVAALARLYPGALRPAAPLPPVAPPVPRGVVLLIDGKQVYPAPA
jgi:hypothetical protein